MRLSGFACFNFIPPSQYVPQKPDRRSIDYRDTDARVPTHDADTRFLLLQQFSQDPFLR